MLVGEITSKRYRRSQTALFGAFDKHRCLKAMIYLHNVTEDHGAIRFGKLLSPSEIDMHGKATRQLQGAWTRIPSK